MTKLNIRKENALKEICIVTATRAEYGLLKPLIKKLSSDSTFHIKVVVTGSHLSPEFGLTYREIENDDIKIDKKIEILLSADTPTAISKTMGLAIIAFADYFSENHFDAIILLGDRYELLSIACAAMNTQIPIIHLHGGETTEGQVDEVIRNAITKMSYLHMTSTEEYRKRVIQMGEAPERVFCVGALGVENAIHTELIEKKQLEKAINFKLDHPFAVVTFHPVTLESNTAEIQVKELLAALDSFPEWKFIITKANADVGGRIINKILKSYASSHSNVRLYDSLGVVRYLSALKYCNMVIGNSSSGILEAPTFHIPTINIGDRQRGRIKALSVIDCLPERNSIERAMKRADFLTKKGILKDTVNPYGDGNTSDRIIQILKNIFLTSKINLKKEFYNIEYIYHNGDL